MRAVHAYAKAQPDCLAAMTLVLDAIKDKKFKLKLFGTPSELLGFHLTLSLTAGCVTLRKGEEPIQLHSKALLACYCYTQ